MSEHHPGEEGTETPRPQRRPGQELRAARERAGIDAETVADRLRIAMPQFEALESDDYAQLPPPTFVRGYIRAYAREVGIDADELIAAYDATGADAAEPAIVPAAGGEPAGSGRGALVGALLILLAVGGGAGIWFYQHRALPPETVSDDGASASATGDGAATADAGEADADDSGGEAVDTTSEATAAATGAEIGTAAEAGAATEPATGAGAEESGAASAPDGTGDTGAAEPSAAATSDGNDTAATAGEAATGEASAQAGSEPAPDGAGGDTAAATSDATQTATGEPAAETTPSAEDADAGEGSTAGGQAAAAADEAAAGEAAAPDRIVLEFTGASWVRVRDDAGQQLASRLYGAGERLELSGRAPFDVLLGNSPGVRIRLNGEGVDKARFTRGDDTARFLVDGGGARPR